MATFYAWSPIQGAKSDVKVGDEVSKSTLAVSDEDWEYLVNSGVARTTKPPKMEGFSGSMVEWYQKQAKEAAEQAGASIDEAALAAHHAVGEVG